MENKGQNKATIGPSVKVQGEITGEEDILIEGQVEGSINLKQNTVNVAKTGKVKANIYGVTIHVEGEVTGDLTAAEQVVIHKSGRVFGNVSAPRISLEDGARVKGCMDTEVAAPENKAFGTKATRIVETDGEVSAANGKKPALPEKDGKTSGTAFL